MILLNDVLSALVREVSTAGRERYRTTGIRPQIVYLGRKEQETIGIHATRTPETILGLAVRYVDRPSCVAVE